MAALVKSAALLKVLRRNWKQMLRQQHSHTSMSGKSRTVSVHALCSEGQVFPNLRWLKTWGGGWHSNCLLT